MEYGGWRSIPPQMVIYIGQGSLMFICNVVVVAAIVRTAKLHFKEYYPIAALAAADALSGLAFASAGLYRSVIFYRGEEQEQMVIAVCLLVPHSLLFIISQPMASLMLVCINVDRLIAVGAPKLYFRLTTHYSRKLLAVFLTVSLSSSLAIVASSFASGGLQASTERVCSGSCVVHSSLGKQYYFGVRVWSGVMSVALYLVIPVAYRRSRMTVTHIQSVRNRALEMRTQRKLMITIGLSTLCTFVFYVLPNVYRSFILPQPGCIAHELVEYASVVQNCNCIFNIFFYYTRHKEIRRAILMLFNYKPPVVSTTGAR